jgi:hypothetical protein
MGEAASPMQRPLALKRLHAPLSAWRRKDSHPQTPHIRVCDPPPRPVNTAAISRLLPTAYLVL